jgi:hypothetical protein
MDGWIWMDGYGWMDRWIWMDGWMDGWMDEKLGAAINTGGTVIIAYEDSMM